VRRSRFLTAAACGTAALTATAQAVAGFQMSPAVVEQTVSTATLVAPTTPGVRLDSCAAGSSATLAVSWTASASPVTTGYEILRATASGGPYALAGTVGAGTTTFADAGIGFSTTYYYVVEATHGTWTSPESAEVSATTPDSSCT
jgi:hypothetical protein